MQPKSNLTCIIQDKSYMQFQLIMSKDDKEMSGKQNLRKRQ